MRKDAAWDVAELLERITGDVARVVPVTRHGWTIERWTGSRWVRWDARARRGTGFARTHHQPCKVIR